MRCIGDKCDLLEEDGKVIDMETDERGDFHFNALLDAVADWRKQSDTDCSLGGMLS
jgi:lysine-specific histone demethylase 1B